MPLEGGLGIASIHIEPIVIGRTPIERFRSCVTLMNLKKLQNHIRADALSHDRSTRINGFTHVGGNHFSSSLESVKLHKKVKAMLRNNTA